MSYSLTHHTRRERALIRAQWMLAATGLVALLIAGASLLYAYSVTQRPPPVVVWSAVDGQATLISDTWTAAEHLDQARVRGFVRHFLRLYAETTSATAARDFSGAQELMSPALRTMATAKGSREYVRLSALKTSAVAISLSNLKFTIPSIGSDEIPLLVKATRETRALTGSEDPRLDWVQFELVIKTTDVSREALWGLQVDSLKTMTFQTPEGLNAARATLSR